YTPEITVDITGSGYLGVGDFLLGKKKINPLKYNNLNTLIKAGVLCNNANITKHSDSNEFHIYGSQTEAALLVAAAKTNLFKESFSVDRIDEIPFNSKTKMMSVTVKEDHLTYMYSKGAPEVLLKLCSQYQLKNKKIALTDKKRRE